MTAWLSLARWIDTFNERVGAGIYWLILVVVLLSALNAVSRKVFNVSSNAFLEVQWYLFAAVFLLAAGYTLLKNEHVRIDVVAGRLSWRGQLWVDILGTLLFLFPFVTVVLYYSWPYFLLSFHSGEGSSNPGGLIVWPAKLLLPVGFALLWLQGLSQLIKLIAALRGLIDPATLIKHHSIEQDSVTIALKPTAHNTSE